MIAGPTSSHHRDDCRAGLVRPDKTQSREPGASGNVLGGPGSGLFPLQLRRPGLPRVIGAVEAKWEAEEASRAKSAFLANMSHEIRTPLTSILGFAEALGEKRKGEEGAVDRFAGLIEKSGRRLLETLDTVLTLSKLEADQMELEAGPVDLASQAEVVADEGGVQRG